MLAAIQGVEGGGEGDGSLPLGRDGGGCWMLEAGAVLSLLPSLF